MYLLLKVFCGSQMGSVRTQFGVGVVREGRGRGSGGAALGGRSGQATKAPAARDNLHWIALRRKPYQVCRAVFCFSAWSTPSVPCLGMPAALMPCCPPPTLAIHGVRVRVTITQNSTDRTEGGRNGIPSGIKSHLGTGGPVFLCIAAAPPPPPVRAQHTGSSHKAGA